MNKFIALLLILPCIFLSKAYAQDTEPFGGDLIRCMTQIRQDRLMTADPGMLSMEEYEAWLQTRIVEYERNPANATRSVITIPVVVHIIHNGEAIGTESNLSAERVASQIEVLNEDFRRMQGTPGFNAHEDGADIEIEFCLADKDPNGVGMMEAGIDRIDRSSMSFDDPPFTQGYVEQVIKAPTIWDPYKYMNIWVCELQTNVLGFATYPDPSGLPGFNNFGVDDTNDGVVINNRSFGRTTELSPPYNEGRSTTHEVGHWLGLRHIWGDGPCGSDDYCDDTPAADAAHYGCPNAPESCGELSMFQNYMDYTDDRCMNIFTKDQKTRMRVIMDNSKRRKELLQSDACTPVTDPPTSLFEVDVIEGCPGLVVHYQDDSENRPETWEWHFPGGTPATSNARHPVVTYPVIGQYDATLITHNPYGSDTLLKEGVVTVRKSIVPSTFFAEDFEDGVGDWTVENPDGQAGWEINNQIAGSRNGLRAMYMPMYGYGAVGERDRLISPILNFRGKYQVRLRFQHAYRQFSNDRRDSLIVSLSTDGGQTYPHRLFAAAENGLGTLATNAELATEFVPTRNDDWCYAGNVGLECLDIDLSDFDDFTNVRIMFETYNGDGNNLFIDEVMIEGACQKESEPGVVDFRLFPNPNDGLFTLETELDTDSEVSLRIVDLLGRRVYQTTYTAALGPYLKDIDLRGLGSSTYIIELKTSNGIGVKKVVVRP